MSPIFLVGTIDLIILQHKLGADRTEAISAVPVDPQNRLKEIGPVRTIEVSLVMYVISKKFNMRRAGPRTISMEEKARCGCSRDHG